MHDKTFCLSRECGWQQKGSIGVCLYIGETNFAFPSCMSWNGTSAEFLEGQIPPHLLVYD